MSFIFHDLSSFYWLGLQGEQANLIGPSSPKLPNNILNFDTVDIVSFGTKYLFLVKST